MSQSTQQSTHWFEAVIADLNSQPLPTSFTIGMIESQLFFFWIMRVFQVNFSVEFDTGLLETIFLVCDPEVKQH